MAVALPLRQKSVGLATPPCELEQARSRHLRQYLRLLQMMVAKREHGARLEHPVQLLQHSLRLGEVVESVVQQGNVEAVALQTGRAAGENDFDVPQPFPGGDRAALLPPVG